MRDRWYTSLGVLAAVTGCGDNLAASDAGVDAPSAPAFRNPVSLPDAELALQALQLLGAQVPGARTTSCNRCHGLTHDRLRYWQRLTDTALATCFTDLAVSSRASAVAMLDCMRAMPAMASSDFQTRKLGVFAAAAALPWFAYTFDAAYGKAAAPAELDAFKTLAAMPQGVVAGWTQPEFDIVAEWFVRGVPALDATLVTDPPPTVCTPSITGAVATHVAAMATQGWKAQNATSGLAMHGCGAAVDPHDCLQSYPEATQWEVAGQGTIRILADVVYATSFWTRSSADGRFVAHGVASVPGSYVIDLQRGATIPIDAAYDPAFFPDQSGFVFQGGPRNTCAMSILTSNPAAISMTEAGCRAITDIDLYQHLGKLVGGGDYFALDALFVSDDGGKVQTVVDPQAAFGSNARSSFTPMMFDGTSFVPRTATEVITPFEGDTVLSPSGRLTIARLSGPDDVQLGYALREVTATPAGSTYTISAPEIARYCITGGKPAFSYDEKWIAFHHYEANGAANLYLMELSTGAPVKITNMPAGQYALFPHFRSDGWLYAQVRDAEAGHEYTVALAAAL